MNLIDNIVNSVLSSLKQESTESISVSNASVTNNEEIKSSDNQTENSLESEINSLTQKLDKTITEGLQMAKIETVKQSELIKTIVEKYGAELEGKTVKEVVETIVTATFTEIGNFLVERKNVQILRFGTFKPHFAKGREGYNSAIKKKFKSEDHYIPKFTASDILINKVK